jgi:hypothetical protein
MKKSIFILALCALFATGCSAIFRTADSVAQQVRIGMSIDEFKRLAGTSAEIEAMTVEYTVYRIDVWDGPTDDRYVSGAKFFHFDSKGRLFRVDSIDFDAYRRNHHHGDRNGHRHGDRE